MYAAHFAAGLAIKTRAPEAPVWALLTGAFIPDFIWIVLANRGIEPTEAAVFFDDWSHSLATTIVWASLFAMIFWRRGKVAVIGIWIAVFSHFILDFAIHPKFIALYPHSSLHLGLAVSTKLGFRNYWWIQLGIVFALMLVYVVGARRLRLPANLIAASCVAVLALHLLMFPG